MIPTDLNIIKSHLGKTPKDIKLSNLGSYSRAYIINKGEIVFKFKKRPGVTYKNEAKILKIIENLDLKINTQRIFRESEDDSFLALYGVKGKSIKNQSLSESEKTKIVKNLAEFLKNLHSKTPENLNKTSLDEEISAWQERFARSEKALKNYLTKTELEKAKDLIINQVPEKLKQLGEKPVFSHGDFWENNIFLDENNNLGIIDFSDAGYYDEAADFTYLESDELTEKILDYYDADETLREKVRLRRLIKPMFVISAYLTPENNPALKSYATKIKTTIML